MYTVQGLQKYRGIVMWCNVMYYNVMFEHPGYLKGQTECVYLKYRKI